MGMSSSLHSPLWHHVAGLRPRLRAGVGVQRQRYRDQLWYQLADAGTGRRHRLNASAYRFVGCLNGRHTTGEIWDALVAAHGDDALTQDEAIRLLGQLNGAGLLQCELTPDIERLFRQHRQQVRRRRWMELNPLSVRVRLFDPSRYLAVFDPWLSRLFRPAAWALWLAVVLPALLLAAQHWPELRAYAAAQVDTPRYLFIAWCIYPVIKTLHELGHALAVRRWGGAVHDVGFTLFVMVPVPYVDASAASGFRRRSQRAIVSAAGIMAELFIAALALYVWLNVQSGWTRDVAFVALLIGAVSTVAINGNPLLRFDGYHLLCDLLDLPNLEPRSRAWWRNLLQRRIFGIEAPGLSLAVGEGKWLLAYAPLAWIFRICIGLLIALWVSSTSALLGLVIAAAVVVMLLVLPCAAWIRGILQFEHGAARRRSMRAVWTLAAVMLVALAALPLPYGIQTQAVVWLPEQAHVRTQVDGFLHDLRVADGEPVVPGQVLAILDDPVLLARQTELNSRLMALQVRFFNALRTDPLQAQNLSQAIAHAEAEVARIETRIALLQVRSQVAGRMVMARAVDLPGTYLKHGQLLGYVFAPGELVVRAVVPHEDAALVRVRTRSAEVRLEERPGSSLRGQVRGEIPAATFKLPSAALADRNGGWIVTDAADPEHLRTLQPIFTVDVALPAGAVQRIGGRARVRFDFGAEPLAFQWTHTLGQLLLTRFHSAT
jgi:putative peptide zinc metalloprotease protein